MITCQHCNRTDFYLAKKNENMVGAYCKHMECTKWIKWVSKKDLTRYQQQGHIVFSEYDRPPLIPVTSHHEYASDSLPSSFGFSETPTDNTQNAYYNNQLASTEESNPQARALTGCDCCSGVPLGEDNGIEISINRGSKLMFVTRLASGGLMLTCKIEYCPKCGAKL